MTPADFLDGLSNTACAAEVKAFTPFYGSASLPTAASADPNEVCALGGNPHMGPSVQDKLGHTEWVDGRTPQTAFTSWFPPNTKVLCQQGGAPYDVDRMEELAGRDGISLRTGCFCNPGDGEVAHHRLHGARTQPGEDREHEHREDRNRHRLRP